MKEENENPNTDVILLITEKLRKLHWVMEQTQQKLRHETQHTKEALAELFSSLTEKEACSLASDLYWSAPYFASIAKEAYRLARGSTLPLESRVFEEPCPLCDDDRTFRCTSWCDYRNDTVYTKSGDLKRLGGWVKHQACARCRNDVERDERESHRRYEERAQEEAAEIKRLRSLPYREYLQTTHWQDVRYRALRRGRFRCYLCNAERVELHVHHRTYENLGREHYDDLIVLCKNCHRRHHDLLLEPENQG